MNTSQDFITPVRTPCTTYYISGLFMHLNGIQKRTCLGCF